MTPLMALEKCKQQLVARRYDEAVTELERANAAYRSRKLQLVLYLMRTMPQLVRQMYLEREAMAPAERKLDQHPGEVGYRVLKETTQTQDVWYCRIC